MVTNDCQGPVVTLHRRWRESDGYRLCRVRRHGAASPARCERSTGRRRDRSHGKCGVAFVADYQGSIGARSDLHVAEIEVSAQSNDACGDGGWTGRCRRRAVTAPTTERDDEWEEHEEPLSHCGDHG